MVRLSCHDLGKAFGKRWLFRKLSITVPNGSGLVVCGPNGSGKTTFLRLLCGLVTPTEGNIVWHWNGHGLTPRQARLMLGAVLPDWEPYGELTAWENLLLIADLRGVSAGLVPAWLERVGLANALHQLAREFSSGMRMRLKLAMALLHQPTFLLLDEPMAMLDSQGRNLLDELIAEQKRRGIVVIATNDERDIVYGDQQIALGKASLGGCP